MVYRPKKPWYTMVLPYGNSYHGTPWYYHAELGSNALQVTRYW